MESQKARITMIFRHFSGFFDFVHFNCKIRVCSCRDSRLHFLLKSSRKCLFFHFNLKFYVDHGSFINDDLWVRNSEPCLETASCLFFCNAFWRIRCGFVNKGFFIHFELEYELDWLGHPGYQHTHLSIDGIIYGFLQLMKKVDSKKTVEYTSMVAEILASYQQIESEWTISTQWSQFRKTYTNAKKQSVMRVSPPPSLRYKKKKMIT